MSVGSVVDGMVVVSWWVCGWCGGLRSYPVVDCGSGRISNGSFGFLGEALLYGGGAWVINVGMFYNCIDHEGIAGEGGYHLVYGACVGRG